MTEDDLRRKWFPDTSDNARARRMHKVDNRFVNCRHYKTHQDGFICTRKEPAVRKTCFGCRTCPNCDGTLAYYQGHRSHGQSGVQYREAFTCVQCGAYIEHEAFKKHHNKGKDERKSGKCEVEGCRNTAYEGHEYHDLSGHIMQKWIVCEVHHRRVKTWRYNTEKGLEHKPIVVVNGKLHDNPDYRKKQGRKK